MNTTFLKGIFVPILKQYEKNLLRHRHILLL